MKKLSAIICLVAMTLSVAAESYTVTVASTGMSNLLSNFKSSAVVTALTVTSPANNTATVSLVDSVTNMLSYTNAAYSTIGSYATNLITSWTNFFGATNSITNVALIDYSNYVAAAIVSYPVRIQLTVPTNSTTTYSPVNYYFNNGLWCTNSGSGNATVTVTVRY